MTTVCRRFNKYWLSLSGGHKLHRTRLQCVNRLPLWLWVNRVSRACARIFQIVTCSTARPAPWSRLTSCPVSRRPTPSSTRARLSTTCRRKTTNSCGWACRTVRHTPPPPLLFPPVCPEDGLIRGRLLVVTAARWRRWEGGGAGSSGSSWCGCRRWVWDSTCVARVQVKVDQTRRR